METQTDRFSRGRFLAPPSRRPLERANSSPATVVRGSSPAPSRSESVSSTSSKLSFFSMASLRGRSGRSKSVPDIYMDISSPVLISSTNPQAFVQKNNTAQESMEQTAAQLSEQISHVLAEWSDLEEDIEDEDAEEEVRSPTRLSPPPRLPSKALPRLPSALPRLSSHIPPSIKIHSPQSQSRFSLWSEADDCSRASSPTDSTFSRPASECSFNSNSSCSTPIQSQTPASAFFEYNPYISRVAKTGFHEIDDASLAQLSPASLYDHKQASALEIYLSDLGYI